MFLFLEHLRMSAPHYWTLNISRLMWSSTLVDEVGYLSYSNRHADLLFEIVSRRYEQRSTLVTTNRPFSEWSEVFPNAACVVSLVDRLVHRSEIISIAGESYRLKEAREQQQQRDTNRKKRKTSRKKRGAS